VISDEAHYESDVFAGQKETLLLDHHGGAADPGKSPVFSHSNQPGFQVASPYLHDCQSGLCCLLISFEAATTSLQIDIHRISLQNP